MVVLEVSQITMRNWTIGGETASPADIYLCVYFERAAGSCGCCGALRRQRHRDQHLSQKYTDKVREAGEMLWRKYNEDNFLVALFTLEGKPWRSLKTGQVVFMVVEVFRLPRGVPLPPGERGELVQVMRGPLQLGTWRMLTLRPANEFSIDESDMPILTLELRPKSSRPFFLEFAAPDCGGVMEPATDLFGRKNRLSSISQDSFFTFSGSSSGSLIFSRRAERLTAPRNVRQDRGNLANFSPKSSTEVQVHRGGVRQGLEWLAETGRDMPFVRRKRSMSWSERNSSNSRHKASDESSRLAAFSPAGSQCASQCASSAASAGSSSDQEAAYIRYLVENGSENLGLAQGDMRSTGRSVMARRSRHQGMGSRLRMLLVRRHLKSINDKRQLHVPKEYTHWLPDNWEAFWRSCWPADEDMLVEGSEVVPLMEAEFRKDCIIFFNTIFPRAHSEMFETLRALALDPGESKVRFKMLSDKRHLEAFVGRTSSIDCCTFLDLEEDRRNNDEGSRSYRLTGKAVEATKRLQTILSRSKSSLATSLSANSPDTCSDRSGPRKKMWFGLFASRATSSHSSSGSKAKFSSASRSRSFDEVKGTNSMSSSSANVEAVEIEDPILDNVSMADSEVIPDEDVPEASRSVSELPRAPLVTQQDRPSMFSADFLSFQAMRQQPCMCTINTPKGVFVDEYSPRIMLLKRILLCFAVCGLRYTEVSNCSLLAELWPYPLASVLGHGSRVLIRLEDVEASEFINFLMFGDPLCVDWKDNGLPYPLVRRLAATHAVQLEADTGNLVERKLQVMSASDTMQNISDGIRRKHLGINLPIGGVGNPSPIGQGHFVDFTGRVVQKCEGTVNRRSSYLGLRRSRGDDGSTTEGSNSPRRQKRGDRTSPASSAVNSQELARPEDADPVTSRLSFVSQQGEETFRQRPSLLSRASVGSQSMFSLESMPTPRDDPVSPAASATLSQAKKGKRRMRLLHNIQGGHLYVRIDDFGEQLSRGGPSEGAAFGSQRSETRRWLLKQPRGYNLIYEQAKVRERLDLFNMDCGDVLFCNCVPEIRRRRSAGMHRDHINGMTLLRMCSEPSLSGAEAAATNDDVRWAKEIIVTVSRWPLRAPPTAVALKLVLDHFDPRNAQLYGKGGFRSIDDLWRELRAQRSFLMKRGQGLQRYVEPVVLQLRWKGYVLMNTHEVFEDETGSSRTVPRYSFMCAAMRPDEHWKEVLERVLKAEFQVSAPRIFDHVEQDPGAEDGHHTIVEETMDSPSYPGLFSFYRCHMVQWDIKEDGVQVFSKLGLPFNPAERDEQQQPLQSDFSTVGGGGRRHRRRYWRWVPERKAREYQRFVNMDVRTADDRWAKYAFESEGVVQYPTSEEALTILLQRCGLDTASYGEGSRKTLRDFWVELLNQESYLMMISGEPHRIVESLFVKVRWRQRPKAGKSSQSSATGGDVWHVLAKRMVSHPRDSVLTETQTREERLEEAHVTHCLLNTRKYREETWEDCMVRCVRKELGLTKQQVKNLWERSTDEDGRYAFHDLVRPSKSFPGILTLYRTHLVTMTLKEDYASTPGLFAQGEESRHAPVCKLPHPPGPTRAESKRVPPLDLRRLAGGGSSEPTERGKPGSPSRHLDSAGMKATASFTEVVRFAEAGDLRERVSFLWASEDGSDPLSLEEVHGMELWVDARKREEKHRVSSVLIGLEGTAPQRKSPFGVEHDASGTSAKVSATGGHKWRAYGKNNALQIPSDEGGMHLKITRPMFEEFMSTCDVLNLVDPCMDLVPKEERIYSRGELERRHAEKELFKQLLSGNGRKAKRVVDVMKDYCETLRTPIQAYNAIHNSRRARSSRAQQATQGSVHDRVTVLPVSGDVIRV